MIGNLKFNKHFIASLIVGAGWIQSVSHAQTPFSKPFGLGAGATLAGLKAPICTNGTVSSVVPHANRVLLMGGLFSEVGSCSGSGLPINLSTGSVMSGFTFAGMGVDGTINTTISDGAGGWYIGGSFTRVGSYSIANLAKISSTGALDVSFNANVNGPVLTLYLNAGTLYVGGTFSTLGGESRQLLGAVNASTGAVITGFNAGPLGTSVNALTSDGVDLFIGGNFAGLNVVGGAYAYFGGAFFNTSTGLVQRSFPSVDGTVYVSIPDGANGWYIGGSFSKVGSFTRNGLARILSDGTVSDFNPNVQISAFSAGIVNALALNGATLYVGGNFYTVNGTTARNNAAAFNTTTGVATSWNPNADNQVNSLVISGSSIYLGGFFTSLNGTNLRNRLAATDLTNGSATSWNPNINDIVYTLAVGPGPTSTTRLYVGGAFTSAGGSTRNRLASFNITPATPTLDTGWNPNVITGSEVRTMLLSGTTLYVGGTFSKLSSTAVANTRNNLAAVNASTGVLLTWNPNIDNTVMSLGLNSTTLYAGGGFTFVNGSTARKGLAALDTTIAAGTATSWTSEPSNNNYASIETISFSGTNFFVGGLFNYLGGSVRNNLASVNLTTGTLTSWNPNMSSAYSLDPMLAYNPQINSLAIASSTLFVGGHFDLAGGTVRNNAASFSILTGALGSWNPNTNGEIKTLAISGSTIYLGGAFTTVSGTTRNYAAAVNVAGTLNPLFNPNLGGTVEALTIGTSTIYLGGAFGAVNGTTVRNYLAAVDSTNGTATTWAPNINGSVLALAISGTNIYVGGSFNTLNPLGRNNIASFDLATGAFTSWNPNVNGEVSTMAVSGSTVYLGGTFTVVNGATNRNYAAAVNITTGTATSFNPNANSYVRAIAVNGSTVYLGGDFTSVNGPTTRNYLAAVNASTGTATAWIPNPNGPIYALAISGTSLYVGGAFTIVGTTTTRNHLASFLMSTGAVNAFNPDIRSDLMYSTGNVYALAISGSTIYAGGDFNFVNGPSVARKDLAAFDSTTGVVTPWNANMTTSDFYQSHIYALAVGGNNLYVGGEFRYTVGATDRYRLASYSLANGTATSWSPLVTPIDITYNVKALTVVGTNVIAGGSLNMVANKYCPGICIINATTGVPIP